MSGNGVERSETDPEGAHFPQCGSGRKTHHPPSAGEMPWTTTRRESEREAPEGARAERRSGGTSRGLAASLRPDPGRAVQDLTPLTLTV